MTIDGGKDLLKFLDEWWNSEKHDASYLQSEGGIWMMPWGFYSDINLNKLVEKFSGTYRRHTFIQRDFELAGNIDGGGYLILGGDKKSCYHENNSKDFGAVPDRDLVVDSVTRELLS